MTNLGLGALLPSPVQQKERAEGVGWKSSHAALPGVYVDCLGEELAIGSSCLMDLSSCAQEESEIALTACTARV